MCDSLCETCHSSVIVAPSQRIRECVRRIIEAENVLADVRGALSQIEEPPWVIQSKGNSRAAAKSDSRAWEQPKVDSRLWEQSTTDSRPWEQASATMAPAPKVFDPRVYDMSLEKVGNWQLPPLNPAPYPSTTDSTVAPNSDVLDVGVPGVGQPAPEANSSPIEESLQKELSKHESRKVFDTKVSVAEEAPTDMENKLLDLPQKAASEDKYKQLWHTLDSHHADENATALVDQIVIDNVEGLPEDTPKDLLQEDTPLAMVKRLSIQTNDENMPDEAGTAIRESSKATSVSGRKDKQRDSFNYSDVACEKCCCGFASMPIIHPEAKFRLFWMCLGFLFIVYEAYAIPFYLAFDVEARGGLYHFVSVVNTYFIMDIPMTFCTGYTDKMGLAVMRPEWIALRYLRGWFACDVVAGIPWEWMNQDENSSTSSVTRSFRFVRAFRLLRLARLLRLIKLKSVIDKVETYIEASQMITFVVGIVRVLLLLFAVTHWVACVWFVVGKRETDEDTWVKVLGLEVKQKFECYVHALYFSLTTMTTVGYGDITPKNDMEVLFALLVLLVSSIAFAGLMGTLMDLISELNRTHHVLAEKKMNLSRYMHWRAVPRKLMIGIRTHLLFLWDENEGYDAYESEIKTLLPPVLKKELCYHIYGRVLWKAPFFTWMKDYIICVKELADQVQTHFLERGDHLFKLGEPNLQIHMLLTGTVMCSRNEKLWEEEGVEMDQPMSNHENNVGKDWMIPRKKETTLVDIGKDFVYQTKELAHKMTSAKHNSSHHLWSHHSQSKQSHAIHAVLHMQKLSDDKELMEQAAEEALHASESKPSRGIFNSEVMNSAIKKLDRRDFQTRVAARKVQRHFRAKLAARKRRQQSRHFNEASESKPDVGSLRSRVSRMLSKTVEAPAYFGESCLWVKYDDWKTSPPPIYLYSARCECRGELIKIPRTAIENLLETFSPWLEERFEFFRQAVVQGLQAKDQKFTGNQSAAGPPAADGFPCDQEPDLVKAPSFRHDAGMPPILEDWAVMDLDMPDDDTAFQAAHMESLHRTKSSHELRHPLRENSGEDARREDAKNGLHGTFRGSGWRRSDSKKSKDMEDALDRQLSERREILQRQDQRCSTYNHRREPSSAVPAPPNILGFDRHV